MTKSTEMTTTRTQSGNSSFKVTPTGIHLQDSVLEPGKCKASAPGVQDLHAGDETYY